MSGSTGFTRPRRQGSLIRDLGHVADSKQPQVYLDTDEDRIVPPFNAQDAQQSSQSDNEGDQHMLRDSSLIDDAEEGNIQRLPRNLSFADSIFSASQNAPEVPEHFQEPTWDAADLISAVSKAYRRGTYLHMETLRPEEWKAINDGAGASFVVSEASQQFDSVAVKDEHSGKLGSIKSLAMKRSRSQCLTKSVVRSFVAELRVLDHFHSHPFVVDLYSVGWYEDCSGSYNISLQPDIMPSLLLERAEQSAARLLHEGPFPVMQDRMRIIAEVACALEALHSAGIAHGDVKPANVLLFPHTLPREGAMVNSYTAKLSDFGSVVFDTGLHQPYPPGSEGYKAPEVHDAGSDCLVDFKAIERTDVWSFGMFAAVLMHSYTVNQIPERRYHPETRAQLVFGAIEQFLQASALDPEDVQHTRDLMKYTLQMEPSSRRLDRVTKALSSYLRANGARRVQQWDRILNPSGANLDVSYENFKHSSGAVKDFIVKSLKAVREPDVRFPKALWELGVIYLSCFATPDSTVQQGLACIRQSARSGDNRAQSVVIRLHQAFDDREKLTIPYETRIQWLTDAASHGSVVATEDLGQIDRTLQRDARRCFAASCYCASLLEEKYSSDFTLPTSNQGDSLLHRAAATGNVSELKYLVTLGGMDVNVRNHYGETPLVTACRFGEFETAMLLCHQGANANAVNVFGENGLHWAWCFDPDECQDIVQALVASGASLRTESLPRHLNRVLDLLPICSGTPIQRAAARRRLDLVRLFQDQENTIKPSNGHTARRIVLWALRLHQRALLQYIREYCISHDSHDPDLSPIQLTAWMYRGEKLSFLEAAGAGWCSGTSNGCDLPMRFWLACCLGQGWRTAIKETLDAFLEFNDFQHTSIDLTRQFDKAITWAFRVSHYDALVALLELRYTRMPALGDPSQSASRLRFQSEAFCLASIPSQEVYLIDMVYHDKDQRTLAQQAIIKGDRYMFRILTQRYLANAALLIDTRGLRPQMRLVSAGNLLGRRVNSYSVLPYTSHCDLWFANELQHLGVLLTCPWTKEPLSCVRVAEPSGRLAYIPPLMHAIINSQRPYTEWLIRAGASLHEKLIIGSANLVSRSDVNDVDVLAGAVNTSLPEFVNFLLDKQYEYHANSAPLQHYQDNTGYRVFYRFYIFSRLRTQGLDMLDRTDEKNKANEAARQEQMDNCFRGFQYLLTRYPDARNSIPDRTFYGFPCESMTIVQQARGLDERDGPRGQHRFTVALLNAWTKQGDDDGDHHHHRSLLGRRAFPKQPWLSYWSNSPLDSEGYRHLAYLLSSYRDLDYSHLCPSFTGSSGTKFFLCWQVSSTLYLFLFVIPQLSRWEFPNIKVVDHWFISFVYMMVIYVGFWFVGVILAFVNPIIVWSFLFVDYGYFLWPSRGHCGRAGVLLAALILELSASVLMSVYFLYSSGFWKS